MYYEIYLIYPLILYYSLKHPILFLNILENENRVDYLHAIYILKSISNKINIYNNGLYKLIYSLEKEI